MRARFCAARHSGVGSSRPHDTATQRLLGGLRSPRHVPGGWLMATGEGAAETLAGLVLDGALAIEERGELLSGRAAYPVIFAGRREPAVRARLPRLSADALRYAEALGPLTAPELRNRLYRYNTVPASPRLQQRWPTPQAVAAYLAVDRVASMARVDRVARGGSGWHAWRLRGARDRTHGCLTFKLYVSPTVDVAGEAFREVAGVLPELGRIGATDCKISASLFGLLRPDKFVVYFRDRRALERAAVRIARALHGLPAQGVPFTAALTPDGLLSWGVDPPTRRRAPLWRGAESWRQWVTTVLADALVTAARSPGDVAPWRFARDRLSLEGVDAATWSPTPRLLHRAVRSR